MYSFLLKPKWIATHLLVVLLMFTMVNLASWQWGRYNDRKEFNATLVARFDATTKPLEDIVASAIPSDIEWLPAEVRGTYLQGEDISVVNVSQNGMAGYNAITPMKMSDGRIVLVNRGFMPLASEFPKAPSGEVTILGRIRATAQRRTGAVSDPATGELVEIQRIDIDRLQPQIEGELLPVYVQMLSSSPTDSPMLSAIADPDFSNGPHLSYTIQWMIFTVCAAAGWLALVMREARKRRTAQ